jgi:NAD(P)-dependent dehydrogenase (short-subunit alcohol dehydrogenase family)
MDLIYKAADPRILSVSSSAHRYSKLDLQDPFLEQGYSPWLAYGNSKLANVLFARELDRRLELDAASKKIPSALYIAFAYAYRSALSR